MRTKQINFRLEKELETQARKAAAAQGLSIGQYFINLAKRDLGMLDDSVTQFPNSDSTPTDITSTPSYLIDKVERLERLVDNMTSEATRLEEIEKRLDQLETEKISYSDLSFVSDSTPSTNAIINSTDSTPSTNAITNSTDSTPTDTDNTSYSSKTKAYKIKGIEGGEAIIPLDEVDDTEKEHEAIATWLYDNLGEHSISEDDVLEGGYNVTAITSYARNSNNSNNSSDSNGINQTNLAKRLGVNKGTISKAKRQANFSEYTKKKDPEGKAWRYDEGLQLFFIVEDGDDRSDCKADHKPSDDDHPISNGDKYQSELLKNVPFVEQREKYQDQTPSNGSPKRAASHTV